MCELLNKNVLFLHITFLKNKNYVLSLRLSLVPGANLRVSIPKP